VSLVSTLLLFAVPVGALFWIALRDHWARQQSRRGLLDDCARLFDRYALTHGDDSFPRLSGRSGVHNVDVRLISDTMTIRRLPQLWLQVTALDRLEGVSGLAVLVRPSGYEFYSLTSGFHHVIELPDYFPRELIVRGKDPQSARLFEKLAPVMADILSDPRIKEIAVTAQGMRIIRQAGEGRRGDYLLLRQAVFDEAAVSADTLQTALNQIEALSNAIKSEHGLRVPA
jgi:hypothetical protein